MKVSVCFVLILSLCYCSQGGDLVGREDNGFKNRSYKDDGIERPCALDDLDCIRRVFAHNSDCLPVKGPVADPYILDWLPIHLAHANLTCILKNVQVRGLNNWKINEFYINKVTDKLVLEVVFDAITVYSPSALMRYYRKGKEPIELSDYAIVIYKGVSLTLTVPNIKDLQLSAAYVYAYIPDANPPFSVGSAVTDDSDVFLSAVFKGMLSNVAISLREVFIYKGPAFMSAFLESTICDFSKEMRLN